MKACVATGEKRRIECRDIPMPKVEPGWLLLKTKYACICGSDLEHLDGVDDALHLLLKLAGKRFHIIGAAQGDAGPCGRSLDFFKVVVL